jgi:hypothetical protein
MAPQADAFYVHLGGKSGLYFSDNVSLVCDKMLGGTPSHNCAKLHPFLKNVMRGGPQKLLILAILGHFWLFCQVAIARDPLLYLGFTFWAKVAHLTFLYIFTPPPP